MRLAALIAHSVAMAVLLALTLLQAAAQEWSGTITQVESMVGPSDVAGSDRAELDAYAKLLDQRLQRARADLRAAPQLVARVLRGDIGTYQAELERVALARGGVVAVAQTSFVISGQKLVVIGEGPRLVVDRTLGRAIALDGQRRDDVPLAPLPVPIAIDRSAPEVAVAGTTARRIEIKAEGRKYTVLVVPDLPNPYALGLLPINADDKDSLALALAILPGLPVVVEYAAGGVTHRWEVTSIAAGPVDQGLFGL